MKTQHNSTQTDQDMEMLLASLKMQEVTVPVFAGFRDLKTPSPYMGSFSSAQKRIFSLILSVPVVMSVFAIGFYMSSTTAPASDTAQLALLEASNARIIEDIDSLNK